MATTPENDLTEFQLVSPEKKVFARNVHMVVMPGKNGYFSAAHNHQPMVASLNPGIVFVYDVPGVVSSRILITGGFAEVVNGRVTLLSEDAVDTLDTSEEELQNNIKVLEDRIKNTSSENWKQRLTERLEVAEHLLEAYRNVPEDLR